MRASIATLSLLALASCGDAGNAPIAGEQGKSAVKMEAACTIAGLTPAMRETLIVIDRTTVKAANPETFRLENAALWGLVTGLADAQRASDTGAMAPRERLTIALADPATGGLDQLFTGCLPTLSQDEITERAEEGGDGLGSRFMGSDLTSQMTRQRDEFLNQVVIVLATAKFAAQAQRAENFVGSTFARTLKTVGLGRGSPDAVRRVFLFADPAAAMLDVPTDYIAARKHGFSLAETMQANFGQADVYIVPASRSLSEQQRAFLDAVVLGSRGDLKAVAPFSSDSLAKAPAKVVTYRGELPLDGEIKSPLELRLAAAADGTLVNSWISYTASSGVRATPVAGQFVCSAEGRCNLRGDPGLGLGQRWRTEPGGSPQPLPGGPFGGLRLIEGEDDGQQLRGRIYDPIILVGDRGDIPLSARRAK